MCRIAFGNKDRIASTFGDKGVLSVALALEGTDHLRSVIVEAELSFFNFGNIIVIQKVM